MLAPQPVTQPLEENSKSTAYWSNGEPGKSLGSAGKVGRQGWKWFRVINPG